MPGGQKVPKFLAVKQKPNNAYAPIVIKSSLDGLYEPSQSAKSKIKYTDSGSTTTFTNRRKLVGDPLAESAVVFDPDGPKVIWQPLPKNPNRKRGHNTCAVATCFNPNGVSIFPNSMEK